MVTIHLGDVTFTLLSAEFVHLVCMVFLSGNHSLFLLLVSNLVKYKI